jgi:hypothetical protein
MNGYPDRVPVQFDLCCQQNMEGIKLRKQLFLHLNKNENKNE